MSIRAGPQQPRRKEDKRGPSKALKVKGRVLATQTEKQAINKREI